MPNIDNLDIQIRASASNANKELERLSKNISLLSATLSNVNSGSLNGFTRGLEALSKVMATFNASGIKTQDFTRLRKNIDALSHINSKGLYNASSGLSKFTKTFASIGNISAGSEKIVELANAVSKLGRKSTESAIANMPALGKALTELFATLSKAPVVSKNLLHMTRALANLVAQGSKTSVVSKGLSASMDKVGFSMNRTRKHAFSLAAAFGKFYASYFLIIRGAKGFLNAIKGTADYLETYNYYTVASEKVTSEWNSSAKELTGTLNKLSGVQLKQTGENTGLLTESGLKNLGLNIKEITQYASQLVSVTNSLGLVGEVSLDTADTFVRLAGDISSLFNIDYKQAATNLQSGLIGQSRALYKYGIDITNATLQTYAYANGVKKSVSEMTQAEKMQLRVLAILDQSKVSWGDLANTIESPSNMIRQFKNNLSELSTIIGQLFIPVLQRIMPVVNGVTIALKRLFTFIASLFGIELDLSSFGKGYNEIADSLEDVSDGFDKAGASAKKFKNITLGIDELNINAPQENGGGGGFGGDPIDLSANLKEAMAEYNKVWEEAYKKMESKAQKFADKVEKIIEPVKKMFKDIFAGEWDLVGQDVSGMITAITDFFTRAIDGVDWEEIGKNIGEFFNGIEWTEILKSVGNFFETIIKSGIELWASTFKTSPALGIIVSTLLLALPKSVPWKLKLIITATIGGFELGKEIGKNLFPDDATFFEDFTWFGDDGFFATLGETSGKEFASAFLESIYQMHPYTLLSRLFTKDDSKITEFTWTGDDGFFQTMKDSNPKELLNALAEWQFDLLNLQKVYQALGVDIQSGTEMISFQTEVWKNFGFEIAQGGIMNLEELRKKFGMLRVDLENLRWKIEGFVQKIKDAFLKLKKFVSELDFKEALKTAFKGAIEALKEVWNKFADSLNEKLQFTIGSIKNPITGSVLVEEKVIDLGKIPKFRSGGFPEDGLFMANHNELVGKFSNGNTAVANNEQIIAGIEQAAYNGFVRAISETDNSAYLAQIARNTRESADKELIIGDKAIAQASKRGSARMGYSFT